MIVDSSQRWRDRRGAYVPAKTVIRTAEHDVEEVAGDAGPKAFVVRHHYAGSYPAARFRFSLLRRGELVGVAVFSHPVRDEVLTNVFPGAAADSVELGRFVLLDDVAGNGETWFLARCFERLRGRVAGVVSFSDPVARTSADGARVFPGHLGTIYQAHNAVYLGRARPHVLLLLPDGSALNKRTLSKVLSGDRGRAHAAALLVKHGAPPPKPGEDLRAWATAALPSVTRRLAHGGNLKYAWPLCRSARRALPPSLPYPKFDALG